MVDSLGGNGSGRSPRGGTKKAGDPAAERQPEPRSGGPPERRLPHPSSSRQARGRSAEEVVCRYLAERGFEIVAHNLRLGALELDIVARKADLVAVVEVRTRSAHAWTTAHGSILPRKRERLRRAAQRLWRIRYRNDPSVTRLRIDTAAVVFAAGGPRVDYCAAAFSL